MLHADVLKEIGFYKNEAVRTAMGKFYTGETVYDDILKPISNEISDKRYDSFKVVDPFCGDGRLISELIRYVEDKNVSLKWSVHLWDYDEDALMRAEEKVLSLADSSSQSISIHTENKDSLLNSNSSYGEFDCVVTNPPWDTVKPDSREIEGMDESNKEKYREALNKYDLLIEKNLPFSQPKTKYGGWGTNLSRCGTELSINLLKDGGICGIVTPLSLLMDQNSEPLRRFVLKKSNILRISYYPAEAKLFDGVDQESVSFVLTKESKNTSKTKIKQYDRECNVEHFDEVKIPKKMLSDIRHCIPVVFGKTLFNMLKKWDYFKPLQEYEEETIWMGRELDETGYKEWISEEGKYLFAKGRHVGRYKFLEDPSMYVDSRKKTIPDSADRPRLAWRDVARRSRSRRVQATLLEPGMVTGNSLHVAYFMDDATDQLQALLVLFNSIPFEFQVRALLGTGHISLGVVRKARVPDLNDPELVEALSGLFSRTNVKGPEDEALLEVAAAMAYGLSKGELQEIISKFKNLPDNYTRRIIDHDAWNSRHLESSLKPDPDNIPNRNEQLSLM